MKTEFEKTFRRLSEKEADTYYPQWRNCANIHKSGSLTGMRNKFGWRGLVIQVGSYYYHIGNHMEVSSIHKMFNTIRTRKRMY